MRRSNCNQKKRAQFAVDAPVDSAIFGNPQNPSNHRNLFRSHLFVAMSDLSASSSIVPPYYDPIAIEARLNALTGMSADVPEPEETGAPELLDQFLANTSLGYLGSRTITSCDLQIETLIEYHRIDLQPNQTRTILHLSFRPDFVLPPSVEATLVDASGRVRVTHSTVFGARVEITTSKPQTEPTCICVETVCTSCPNE